MRSSLLQSCAILALVLWSPLAHSEPSSWLGLGTGVSDQHDFLDRRDTFAFAVAAEVGVGTDPIHPMVFGGTLRALWAGGLGADLSVAGRIATSGFVKGEWGAAVDLGIVGRWWGHQEYGHFPFQPVVTLGFPAGLQLELAADLGDVTGDSPGARGGFALIAVDVFRLATRTAGSQRGFWSAPPSAIQVTEHQF